MTDNNKPIQLGMGIEGVKARPLDEMPSLEDRMSYQLANESLYRMAGGVPRDIRMKDIQAIAERFETYKPFLDALRNAYQKDAPFFQRHITTILNPIEVYIREHGAASTEGFMPFFEAYLGEWERHSGEYGKIWDALRTKGLIHGETQQATAEAMRSGEAYATLLHRPGLDGLTRMNRNRMDIRKNQATGQKTIVVGGLTIEQDYDNVISLLPQQQRQLAAKERTKHLDALFLKLANRLPSVDAMKWLDTCRIILAGQNRYRAASMNTLVEQPLEDIMKLWGIPVTKPSLDKFRRTISEVQEAFYSFSFAFEENIGQGKKEPVHLRILQKRGEVKNNILYARFTEEITAYFCQGYLMEYPLPLMKADGRNPNIYTAGRYLASRYSNIINQQNGKADIISVEALLAALPGIPTYEEVAASRQFKQRIMRPFEAALKGLKDMGFFTWNYCNAKKVPLTKAQKDNFNYETFAECYIQYSFLDAKDYGPLIAAREEKKAASKAKQEARKNKAQGAAE